MILLCGHPDADVRWTVAKDKAITADREHDGPVHRALNLQQRHDRT
jgi:hypothetical protein